MSRLLKFKVVAILAVFLSACNFVTKPEVPTPEATPNFGNIFDPQDTPIQEWRGIPIMPQATNGQEFIERNTYSFEAKVTVKEVQEFYEENLASIGWMQTFGMPNDAEGIFIFQKENGILTIEILPSDGTALVMLTLGQQ